MRGPKPAPTPLRLLKGDQPCRINDQEPEILAGRPACPEHLDTLARQEWDRIIPDLEAMRVLSRVDSAALAIYCVTYGRWLRARASIATEGLVIKTSLGGVKPNPAATIAAVCEAMMHRMLCEFGCTPAARTRIKTGGERKRDSLDEFLARRKRS